MILEIKNFAKISNAKIDINSITVIAGLNNTAKTTVGKLIYCIIKSFNNIELKIETERNRRLLFIINNVIMKTDFDYDLYIDFLSIIDSPALRFSKIIENIPHIQNISIDELEIVVKKFLAEDEGSKSLKISNERINQLAKNILELYSISNEELEKVILLRSFNDEFRGQLSNLNFRDAITEIKLIDKAQIGVRIKNNKIIGIESYLEIENTAIMIDNPFIVDNVYTLDELDNHNSDLCSMLKSGDGDLVSSAFNEIIGNKKLRRVLDKLSTVIQGEIRLNSKGEEVYEENSNAIVVSNLSTGLKTFVIIKKLIQNNALNEKSVLILDEPEIHLHPEWQLIYAELIVLLQKELNLKVIITTHSPYFLNAIEVFSHLHNINDTNYYITQLADNSVTFKNVSNNLEEIYNLLAKPFQTLENINYGGRLGD